MERLLKLRYRDTAVWPAPGKTIDDTTLCIGQLTDDDLCYGPAEEATRWRVTTLWSDKLTSQRVTTERVIGESLIVEDVTARFQREWSATVIQRSWRARVQRVLAMRHCAMMILIVSKRMNITWPPNIIQLLQQMYAWL